MPAKRRVRVVVPVLVRPARMGTEVAGAGCPGSENDGVSLAAASTGPGWATAGGGWTGNGCDGSSVWTMDPDGTSPSTLSWFFYPSMRASACQLAVFVPSQNALGVGSYQVSAGPASLGTVSVDQAGSAGQWVTLGSYPAAGGMLTVQLQPGTATLTAAAGGNGDSGNGSSGNGGNGDSGRQRSRRVGGEGEFGWCPGTTPRWPRRPPGPAAAEPVISGALRLAQSSLSAVYPGGLASYGGLVAEAAMRRRR